MAHHKSAQKRIRQTAKRNARNSYWRSTMRTARKNLRAAIAEGNAAKAAELLPSTVGLVNKLVSKGVLHKNTAQRYVSRDSKAVAAMAAE